MIDVRLPQRNNISIKIEKFMIALLLEGMPDPYGRLHSTYYLGSVHTIDAFKNKFNSFILYHLQK